MPQQVKSLFFCNITMPFPEQKKFDLFTICIVTLYLVIPFTKIASFVPDY
jgi:hypothetical protein